MSYAKKRILSFCIIAFVFFVPQFAFANLVNCDTSSNPSACTICHLIEGIHGVIAFLVKLMVIVAITVITIAGVMYIISAGDTGMTGKAKKAVINTLVGITVVLVAFMSITVILNRVFNANDTVLVGGGLNGMASNAWTFKCDKESQAGKTVEKESPVKPTGPPQALSGLSQVCDAYDESFNKAANNDKDTACLLKAIAMTESGCNASVGKSGAGAVGFMQIKPENAGGADLNNAEQSIQRAAQLLKDNQAQLNQYKNFDVSKGTSLGTEKEHLPDGSMYYSGNDDLIASYNGGGGTKASGGKIGTFGLSEACPCGSKCSPNIPDGYPEKMPAWQCQYFKDGTVEGEGVNAKDPQKQGYKETRDYVQKVQMYQKSCMGKQ